MGITLCQGDMTEWLGKKLDEFFTCQGEFYGELTLKWLADLLKLNL